MRTSRLTAAGLALVGALTAAVHLVPAARPAVAAEPSSYRITGVDTSHYNHAAPGGGETARIDWRKVAASESFAFLKATQHTTGKDAWFAADWKAVSATSLARAPYHFFDPRGPRDGVAQAEHFVRTVRAAGYTGARPGELPPVLDVEKVRRDGKEVCPPALRADQVQAFLRRVRAEFRVTPIVYTRASFVRECMNGDGRVFAGHPLWLARYGSGAGEPQPVPGAAPRWTFWQHAETGRVPGIPTAVDRDVYAGTRAQLRALAHLPAGTPTPAPLPVPAPPADWPTVRTGQRGPDVRTAQTLLGIRDDGRYGPDTTRAVRDFQRGHRLRADGVVGPRTWTALVRTVRTGDSGAAVRAVQHQLATCGHRVTADGRFGPDTARAVRDFQRGHRLTPDGVAGPTTWRALLTASRG
ncbi:peptidoglycan-binding protein [Streptomyces sp. NPDC014773]|uniref:peptidoglycan-binding protein n=1 Tax=Streptomyces sp. NPDC014773 TaxID=3364908 RepID=UPI0036FF5E52